MTNIAARRPVTVAEKMVVVGVSWESYEHLRSDFANRPSIRLTYDRGTLGLLIPSYGHERLKTIIGDLVVRLAFELDIDYEAAGSTTFKRESLGAGFEGDESFYFSHLQQIRQRSELDLAKDPPPDLVIEIDVSSPSLSKFPIFAALGIPEIWRFHENRLLIYSLADGAYREAQSSAFLLGITAGDVTNLVEAREQMPPNAWQRKVSDYASQIRARGK